MSTPEQVFTAKQAAQRLGLSLAMTRRYGAALEALTGEAVRQSPRDGRLYRRDQLDALMRARDLIRADPQLSVTAALARALGSDDGATQAVATLPESVSPTFSDALARELLSTLEGVRAELAAAHADREELRELRAEVAALRSEADQRRALPAPDAAATGPGSGGSGPKAWLLRQLTRLLQS